MKIQAKLVLVAVLMLLYIKPTQAQLFKKLAKKAEEAVERSLLNRTDKEVSKGTDKAIDAVIDGGKQAGENDPKKKSGTNRGVKVGDAGETGSSIPQTNAPDNAAQAETMETIMGTSSTDNIPDQYTFSYKVTMKTTDSKAENEMEYWLEPGVNYFGIQVQDAQAKSNNITIMDLQNESMVMFMDDNNQKMAMSMKPRGKMLENFKKKISDQQENEQPEKMAYNAIEDKTILGYHCKGFEMTDKEGVYKFWITDETPAGMFMGGMADTKHLPNGTLPMGENSMLMEMKFEPSQGKSKQFHMICTEFEQESLTINKSDYTFNAF